jgi:hypothetical protein
MSEAPLRPEPAARRTARPARAPRARAAKRAAPGPMQVFLANAREYKEAILLVAGLVSAGLFVRDYFATKEEVDVLKCQAENGIAIIESRMNGELLAKRVLALGIQVEDARKRSRGGTTDSLGLKALQLEEDNLRKQMSKEQDTQARAGENLKPGACEKIVRKK